MKRTSHTAQTRSAPSARGTVRAALGAVLAASVGCGRTPTEPSFSESTPRNCAGDDERRYAAEVFSYEPSLMGQPPTDADVLLPEDALGAPNWTPQDGDRWNAVALGSGGRIELGFGGCLLTTDRSRAPDLAIYEIGRAVESAWVLIRARPESIEHLDPTRRTDGRYFFLGEIGGGYVELDIDPLAPGGEPVYFDAIMMEDDPNQGTGTQRRLGADIDAVELLSWVHPDDI